MKRFLGFLAILWLTLLTSVSYAGRGCCSWHGGVSHCASNGRYVCNDGTYSPSCTCSSNSYNYSNNYDYSNSYYNSYTIKKTCQQTYGFGAMDNYDGTCSCMAGYTWGKDFFGNVACITLDQACKNQYGLNAKSSGNGYCGCNLGYIMKDGQCVDEMSEKWQECNKIGNSVFDYASKTCSCKPGYIFDGNNCISQEKSCQDQYGFNATAGDPGYCVCKNGYERSLDRKFCIKSYIYENEESSDVIQAKQFLGEKSSMIESVADLIKTKDKNTQEAISDVIKTFKTSKDEYTRSVGVYLEYLLNK